MATFIEAAQVGDYDNLFIHVQRGSDPNSADANGKTALMYASENDHLPFVTKLVAYGADYKRVDMFGNSALSCASSRGNLFIVRYLLDIGAPIDATSIAKSKNTVILDMLLTRPEITNLNLLHYKTRPLIFAFMHVNTEECYRMVHLLMRHGADPNISDLNFETPLMALVKHVKNDDAADKLFWVTQSIKLMIYMGADYTKVSF